MDRYEMIRHLDKRGLDAVLTEINDAARAIHRTLDGNPGMVDWQAHQGSGAVVLARYDGRTLKETVLCVHATADWRGEYERINAEHGATSALWLFADDMRGIDVPRYDDEPIR